MAFGRCLKVLSNHSTPLWGPGVEESGPGIHIRNGLGALYVIRSFGLFGGVQVVPLLASLIAGPFLRPGRGTVADVNPA